MKDKKHSRAQWFYNNCYQYYLNRSSNGNIAKKNNYRGRNMMYKFYVHKYGIDVLLPHISTIKRVLNDIETKAFQAVYGTDKNPPCLKNI